MPEYPEPQNPEPPFPCQRGSPSHLRSQLLGSCTAGWRRTGSKNRDIHFKVYEKFTFLSKHLLYKLFICKEIGCL